MWACRHCMVIVRFADLDLAVEHVGVNFVCPHCLQSLRLVRIENESDPNSLDVPDGEP